MYKFLEVHSPALAKNHRKKGNLTKDMHDLFSANKHSLSFYSFTKKINRNAIKKMAKG